MTVPRPVRPQRLVASVLSLAIVLAALAPSVSLPIPFARAQDEPVPSGDIIVVLEEGATRAEVRAAAAEEGVQPDVVFTEVFDGFAASGVTPAEAEALAAAPDVAGVFPDSPVYAAAQTLPTGVDRIDAATDPRADIDGVDDLRVDADIAVLDSGVDGTHPDLNVVPGSGADCQDTPTDQFTDETGHGTHVAGIAAAIDNAIDTVGVAPGARIHSVKVLKEGSGNPSGVGSISTLICGLEWVATNAGTIDVVNMSITGGGSEGPACGQAGAAPLRTAVCAVVDAGIPVVAAAGNSAVDTSSTVPATYPETIAVSALADLDGEPGGDADATCNPAYEDDTLAPFSNHGDDVDIAAPGTCIVSSNRGGGTTSKSGTSMATPHVTGAAALYLAENPAASPADVRAWLLSAASEPQNSAVGFTGDRDDSPEPVLWLGAGDQPTMTPTNTPTSTATATSTPLPTTPYRLTGGGRSVNSASYTYVRDGNQATVWKSKRFASGPPAGAYVYVDLASPKPIGTVRWLFGEYGYADVFRIEVSNDAASWTQVTRRNGKPPGAWHEKVLPAPVTARYVRFFFENPRGDLYLGGIAEIQVWAPNEAPPLPTATPTATPTPALGGGGEFRIVSSTRSSNSLDAGLAHDGSTSTSWRTSYGIPAPTSAEVRFAISSVQVIGTVRWVFNVGGRADAFTIAVSDDGQFWETVHTGSNSPSGAWQEVDLPAGTTGRHVRFRFTNPNGDAALGSLAEVQIYPPLGGGALPDPVSTSTPLPTVTLTTVATETSTPIPTETPTVSPTQTSEVPPVSTDASPIADPSITPTSGTATTDPDTAMPTTAAHTPTSPADAPTATSTLGATPPAATTMTPTPTESREPTPDLQTPTTNNQPPVVPIVSVRRTANTANGWTALDADPATVWGTTVTPPGRLATLTLDLGDPQTIAALAILTGPDGFAGVLTIETSDDLATWTYLASPSPADVSPGEWTTLSLNTPVTTRYVRLVFVNPGDLPTLGGIAEFLILAPTDAT